MPVLRFQSHRCCLLLPRDLDRKARVIWHPNGSPSREKSYFEVSVFAHLPPWNTSSLRGYRTLARVIPSESTNCNRTGRKANMATTEPSSPLQVYRDFSRVEADSQEGDSNATASGATQPNGFIKFGRHDAPLLNENFPAKWHHLLSEMERTGLSDIASWAPHGRCFVVHKPNVFVDQILRLYVCFCLALGGLRGQVSNGCWFFCCLLL